MRTEVALKGDVPFLEATREGVGVNRETLSRFKILSHFIKTNLKAMCLSCPMPLIKVNIFLINMNILVKLNLLKNCDFL
jgi:hypothetical protein